MSFRNCSGDLKYRANYSSLNRQNGPRVCNDGYKTVSFANRREDVPAAKFQRPDIVQSMNTSQPLLYKRHDKWPAEEDSHSGSGAQLWHEPEDDDDGGFRKSTVNGSYYSPPRQQQSVVVRNGSKTSTMIAPEPLANENRSCCPRRKKSVPEANPNSSVERKAWKSFVIHASVAGLLAAVLVVCGMLIYYNYYVIYTPRELPHGDMCEKTYCSYGAKCVDEGNGRISCRCPSLDECPVTEAPVCGSDGQSYRNLCHLQFSACNKKMTLIVVHDGFCEYPDPCRNVRCPYGGRCVPVATENGSSTTCECPTECPNLGDHDGSKPVCGTDGVDYQNICHLQRAACGNNASISVKYQGACDPCDMIECSEPEVCQLDPNRNAVCRCSETCPIDFNPVCGSDGKTYSNECNMRQQACYYRKNIRVVYRGKCSSGANACVNVKCRPDEECVINKFGIAACECLSECEPMVKPACGSDGVTYDSECHLRQTSCLTRTNISLTHIGVCGDSAACEVQNCDFGSICVQRKGTASCECAPCSNEYEPVCASDGLSYNNQCKARLEACKHRRHVQILYEGLCNGCETKKCDFYSTCEIDDIGDAKCVCPDSCTQTSTNLVCGSNGKTYNNECELRKVACELKEMLTVAYKGDCDLCIGVRCKYGARCESGKCICPADCSSELLGEPICASDWKTYENECEMRKYACSNSLSNITALYYGHCKDTANISLLQHAITTEKHVSAEVSENKASVSCSAVICDYYGTCEIGTDGYPRCSCLFNCTEDGSEEEVCGSDMLLHASTCHMNKKACQTQEEIRVRPLQLCQGMEVKPCNGRPPLIDNATNLELDCGDGPNRVDCPSDSYCHNTQRFSKCCYKSSQFEKNCLYSWFGCCPDNETFAQGPDNAGCPSMCNCNRLGADGDICDPKTGQCVCKPKVGGLKCDRCEPAYWGLPKISMGHPGCLPCGCSVFGSARDDCEQMTGRCVCKAGVTGHQCDTCIDSDKILGPNGCYSLDVSTMPPTSCAELSCYFGATCEVVDGIARCNCPLSCADEPRPLQAVCGNDAQTYSSKCQLELYSCRYQKEITIQALSACTDDLVSSSGTTSPLKSNEYLAEPDAQMLKSTDVLLASINPFDRQKDEQLDYINELAAEGKRDEYNVIDALSDIIGSVCVNESSCKVVNSVCNSGICSCQDGYNASVDRQHCLPSEMSLAATQAVCYPSPCLNNAPCIDLKNGKFKCECSYLFTGVYCEKPSSEKEIEIPAFSGQSYVQLKQLKAYHKFSVEIEFKAYKSNGILLYSQQRDDGTGDYISLTIINGFVEFRYNLGNGAAILRSTQHITLNEYHKVVAKRYQRDGILQVDSHPLVTGQSEGTLRALDLDDSAFVGYIPTTYNKVFENAGTSVGFVGCMKKVKMGRHVVHLNHNTDNIVQKIYQLKECSDLLKCDNASKNCNCFGDLCSIETDPCISSPCQFGASCEPLLQGSYLCKCLPGHTGDYCEIFDPNESDLYIPEFNGVTSYSKFPSMDSQTVKRAFSIEIWFLPYNMNGVLFYNGQMPNRRGDFVSINLVNGHVQFRFNLGSGIANITTENQVMVLNQWHVVKVHRYDRVGSVQLDNGSAAKGISGSPLNELNLELPLYLGGFASLSEISRESGISERFSGAIQRVLLNGNPLRLLNGEMVDVLPYSSHACTIDEGVCLNGGTCVPHISSFLCYCPPTYKGERCQEKRNIENEDYALYLNGNQRLVYLPGDRRGPSSSSTKSVKNGDGALISAEYWDILYTNEMDNYNDYYSERIDDDIFEYLDNDEDFSGPRRKAMSYELAIKTSEPDGTLLWSSKSQPPMSNKDSLSLVINNGYVELIYIIGLERISVKSKERVSDGLWHLIWIQHRKRMVQLKVDKNKATKAIVDQPIKYSFASGKLHIGGYVEDETQLTVLGGFKGCIMNVSVDRRRVPLLQLSLNSSQPLQMCSSQFRTY